jgi:hypothetical protein
VGPDRLGVGAVGREVVGSGAEVEEEVGGEDGAGGFRMRISFRRDRRMLCRRRIRVSLRCFSWGMFTATSLVVERY